MVCQAWCLKQYYWFIIIIKIIIIIIYVAEISKLNHSSLCADNASIFYRRNMTTEGRLKKQDLIGPTA